MVQKIHLDIYRERLCKPHLVPRRGMSGTVEHYWYDLGRQTKEAAILETDPEFRIGLIYSFMANLNSEPPTPRPFHPLMRLFDYMAACRPL